MRVVAEHLDRMCTLETPSTWHATASSEEEEVEVFSLVEPPAWHAAAAAGEGSAGTWSAPRSAVEVCSDGECSEEFSEDELDAS